jgi:hypothetical protein
VPAAPQVASARVEQVGPEQQPAQLLALHPLHTPPAQVPPLQFWQAPPPLPQLVEVLPTRHAPPAQQPLGQEVPSHTHAPATHRWPAAHAAPVPHRHPIPATQLLAVIPQFKQAAPPEPQVASDEV